MSDPVELRVSTLADCVTLRVAGEIDLVSAPDVDAAITRHLSGVAPTRFVLDLSDVTFFGSPGLALLVRAAESTTARGVELRIVANSLVLRTMELTGTLDLFPTYATLADALGVDFD